MEIAMAAKLNIGDPCPRLTLKLTDGGTLALPDGVDAKYKVVLFYRGHW
jgi:peroxiredoxin